MNKVIVKWDKKEPLITLTIQDEIVYSDKEKALFDSLLLPYSKALAQYITRLYRLRDSVDDQSHDVYICAYDILPKYDYLKSSFCTHLKNKYMWKTLDALKSKKERSKMGMFEVCWSESDIVDVSEEGTPIRKYEEE